MNSVGFAELAQPLHGTWPAPDFPESIALLGKNFRRSHTWAFPYNGVAAQYREDVDRHSMHLLVHDDGTWTIDHIDDANPERGLVLEHAIKDVSPTKVGAVIVLVLAVGASAGIASALARRAH